MDIRTDLSMQKKDSQYFYWPLVAMTGTLDTDPGL